jgi:hypothetical protein
MGIIPSAVAAQAVAAAGADFLLIDREHAPIGRESLHAMIAATAGTECGRGGRLPGDRVGRAASSARRVALRGAKRHRRGRGVRSKRS